MPPLANVRRIRDFGRDHVRSLLRAVYSEQIGTSARQPDGAMMSHIEIFNPAQLGKPLGQYSQIARVRASEFVFIAGQLATDASGTIVGENDFDAQCAQVYRNIEIALSSVGATWNNVVQFTTYLVHSQDIPKFMDFRKRHFPSYFKNGLYPPNTLLMIDRLVQEPFVVEVQTVAAL
jgi:enamine deaminase RidA (YjgF/YER057c/UK114 family)